MDSKYQGFICVNYIIRVIIKVNLIKMGTCQTLCEQVSNSSELENIFLRDKNTGKFVNLTQEERKNYWSKIKEYQIYQNLPNELFPNLKNDQGFIYKPQKYFYEGKIKQKMPHGRGRLNLLDQRYIINGTFKQGKLDGDCAVEAENLKIEGRWVNGFPHHVRFQKNNGQYFIEFQNENTTKGKIIFPNGNIYKGQFRYDFQDRIHIVQGKGVLTSLNGNVLKGEFVNGYLEGQGRFQSKASGYVYQGNFKKGLFDGFGLLQMGDNGTLKINWTDNLPNGQGEFIKNGIALKINYVNGVRKQSKVSEEMN